MRVAFLVLATQNHETFSLLPSWFNGFDCDYYVHVDAKHDAAPFRQIAETFRHVHLLDNRTTVSWGGFSMITAEVALMEAALHNQRYDRFILISDDTLPIRQPERIFREISNDKEMIGTGATKDNGILCRYHKFYMNDFAALSPRHRHVSERGISSEDLPVLLNFASSIAKGKKKIADLHYGSQWWCLTGAAIEYFLSVYYEDEHLRMSFEYSAIPDEHYIQTVIATSNAFSSKLVPPVMYVDFTQNPKPFVLRSVSDLDAPLNSKRLFARKFGSDAHAMLEAISMDQRSK